MKKKVIAISLVLALVAVAIASVTIAYFTDTEEATNVFTVGNVEIDLLEANIHRHADSYLANGTDGFLPDGFNGGEATDDDILAADELYQDYLAAQELMPGVSVNKMPYVKNTGKSDAYVRIRVMIPSALDLNCLNSSVYCSTALEEEFTFVGDWATPVTTTVDGVEFDVYTFVRNEALAADEMTYWNVWNTISLDADTTSAELEAYIAAGAITEDGQFNVLVQADAIQAATFANATEAFAAFDAQ